MLKFCLIFNIVQDDIGYKGYFKFSSLIIVFQKDKQIEKKFSNKEIYNNNLPENPSCKTLYKLAEKTRYELLGCQMLKGIEKNLNQNYYQIMNIKKEQKLNTKEDVMVSEAFELYLLKNFQKIKLNSISEKKLYGLKKCW